MAYTEIRGSRCRFTHARNNPSNPGLEELMTPPLASRLRLLLLCFATILLSSLLSRLGFVLPFVVGVRLAGDVLTQMVPVVPRAVQTRLPVRQI